MELEGNFHGHWQIFIGRFSIIASTSPAKHFEANTKIENCKSLNFYPLRSKRFQGLLASTFRKVVKTVLHSMCLMDFIEKKSFQKKAFFKVNLALRAEKLKFRQTFSVRLVIADFYVSRRPFKEKLFGKQRVSSSKLADQNLFRIRQTFLCGSRNWNQIVQQISCGNGNFIF